MTITRITQVSLCLATDGVITDSWQGPYVRAQSSPSWSQCAMCPQCAHARCTLRAPVHAASALRQTCVLSPGASCSRSKCQQPGDKIRATNTDVLSESRNTIISFLCGSYFKLNQVLIYRVLLNWTALFRIDGSNLEVYSEGESFPTYTNLYSSYVSKYRLNIIPISYTINYKSCNCRAPRIAYIIYFLLKKKENCVYIKANKH